VQIRCNQSVRYALAVETGHRAVFSAGSRVTAFVELRFAGAGRAILLDREAPDVV